MSFLTGVGIAAVLALLCGAGVYSGRKVKSGSDFLTGGGTAGPGLVCGTVLGSLISGQSTIGTVQLAFHFGMSAWWYTLGAGLSGAGAGLCPRAASQRLRDRAADHQQRIRRAARDDRLDAERRGYLHHGAGVDDGLRGAADAHLSASARAGGGRLYGAGDVRLRRLRRRVGRGAGRHSQGGAALHHIYGLDGARAAS